MGAAFGLEGKVYVSEAYFSPTFTRYVLALGVPVPGADGVPVGAVTARYDIQGDFAQLLAPARFGKTGYVVLVDQQGRILAHPRDPARVGEDISRYPAVQGALQGGPGWVRGRNAAGAERLFVYRSIENPASTGRRPWILLTEVDPAEALAPNKEFGTTILITEATYAEVDGEFECRLMPQTSLRGKTQAMRVYEVTSRKISPTVD